MANYRALTEDEQRILRLVGVLYGPANDADAVIFSDRGDAVIWARDETGAIPIVVNLTNVAMFAKTDNLSDDEVLDQWLRRPGTG